MDKNLAKTYDPKSFEDRIYSMWEENGAFRAEVDESKKPFSKGYRIAAMRLGLPKHALAAVGDQIFTDVLGANRFKIKMLYTLPIGNTNSKIHKIRKTIESPFIPKKIYCSGGRATVEHRMLRSLTYKERF